MSAVLSWGNREEGPAARPRLEVEAKGGPGEATSSPWSLERRRGQPALSGGLGEVSPASRRRGCLGTARPFLEEVVGKRAEPPRPVPGTAGLRHSNSRAGRHPRRQNRGVKTGAAARPGREGAGLLPPRGGVAGDRCGSASHAGPVAGALPGPGGTAQRQADPSPPKMSRRGLRDGRRVEEPLRSGKPRVSEGGKRERGRTEPVAPAGPPGEAGE